MAIKQIDTTNTGSLNGLPQGYDGGAQVIDFTKEHASLFDILNQEGINLFGMNAPELKPMTLSNEQLAYGYLVKEYSKFGLAGEYNTHVGVKLYTGSSRYIEFVYGKEEAFQAMEYDPIADGPNKAGLAAMRNEDYAKALVKAREPKLLEQVLNSGILLQTTEQYQAWYDELNTGLTAPADPHNMTGDELESFALAMVAYFEEKGIDTTPVIVLGNKEWNTLVKSPDFADVFYNSNSNQSALRKNEVGEIHGCLFVKYGRLGMKTGAYKDVDRLVLTQGTIQGVEKTVRPVTFRPFSEAVGLPGQTFDSTNGNKVMDMEFYSGTFEQFFFITDNLYDEETATYSLTERHFVCAAETFAPDTTKVLFGTIKGEKPQTRLSVNRTASQVISGTYDNAASDFSQVPASNDGSYVEGSAFGDETAEAPASFK